MKPQRVRDNPRIFKRIREKQITEATDRILGEEKLTVAAFQSSI